MSKQVLYLQLDHEDYKDLEQQMKEFKETEHTSVKGFYHKSIRLRLSNLVVEFTGPVVRGYD